VNGNVTFFVLLLYLYIMELFREPPHGSFNTPCTEYEAFALNACQHHNIRLVIAGVLGNKTDIDHLTVYVETHDDVFVHKAAPINTQIGVA